MNEPDLALQLHKARQENAEYRLQISKLQKSLADYKLKLEHKSAKLAELQRIHDTDLAQSQVMLKELKHVTLSNKKLLQQCK